MLFCGWCRGRGIAPVNATIPMIVDFLVHLRPDKGLSVSAVKGYRSALNSETVMSCVGSQVLPGPHDPTSSVM